jgi:hypothetical protein
MKKNYKSICKSSEECEKIFLYSLRPGEEKTKIKEKPAKKREKISCGEEYT